MTTRLKRKSTEIAALVAFASILSERRTKPHTKRSNKNSQAIQILLR